MIRCSQEKLVTRQRIEASRIELGRALDPLLGSLHVVDQVFQIGASVRSLPPAIAWMLGLAGAVALRKLIAPRRVKVLEDKPGRGAGAGGWIRWGRRLWVWYSWIRTLMRLWRRVF